MNCNSEGLDFLEVLLLMFCSNIHYLFISNLLLVFVIEFHCACPTQYDEVAFCLDNLSKYVNYHLLFFLSFVLGMLNQLVKRVKLLFWITTWSVRLDKK